MTKIGEFASTVKNQVRPLGLHRLGMPCQLMGTGMAFPWGRIRSAKLATGHIVEDLQLGIELARAGAPPIFCPEALVTSTFAASSAGIRDQRTRWEHGHLSVIFTEAPPLVLHSIRSLNLALMVMALDLCVPPLALLTLLILTLTIASAFFGSVTGIWLPLVFAFGVVLLFAFAAMISWLRYGRSIISLGGLAWAVLYSLWKIPLYARFAVARQVAWVRSKRDKES
jgi:cellulose synthase/poly-beta-1,6-N-acetylglucosamine synthase-like glycosyltransferase